MNDGGPALPMPDQKYPGMPAGMSLRDYFAAAALQGMLSGDCDDKMSSWQHADKAARFAYEFADAMIAERIK